VNAPLSSDLVSMLRSGRSSLILDAAEPAADEIERLRKRIAVLERENSAISEGYLQKLGIKPEDLR
jgi:hypothetical protein